MTDADPAGDRVAVHVAVPTQLRDLARSDGHLVVTVPPPVTVQRVVDALEVAHPTLAGTIRDRATGGRRAMIRVYADGEDYSDTWVDRELPAAVLDGREPVRLVGAIAGG
jgi:molybdopterin synthase sulfur carrier subunit